MATGEKRALNPFRFKMGARLQPGDKDEKRAATQEGWPLFFARGSFT